MEERTMGKGEGRTLGETDSSELEAADQALGPGFGGGGLRDGMTVARLMDAELTAENGQGGRWERTGRTSASFFASFSPVPLGGETRAGSAEADSLAHVCSSASSIKKDEGLSTEVVENAAAKLARQEVKLSQISAAGRPTDSHLLNGKRSSSSHAPPPPTLSFTSTILFREIQVFRAEPSLPFLPYSLLFFFPRQH
jgi:hypothetical protein